MFLLPLTLLGPACAGSAPVAAPPVEAAPAPVPAPPAAPAGPPAAAAAAPGAPTDGGVTVPTLLGPVPGVAFVGNWTSPSCGGRDFPRNIRFEADQSYSAIDLISPCPVGTTCVWSGMTGYAGIWVQDGKQLALREIGAPTAEGGPHPTKFESTADGKLVENGCFYTPGLTIPKGYDEARVTPRPPGLAGRPVEVAPPASAEAPAGAPPVAPAH